MAKYYLITLGTLVFALHIPGVVVPVWHRELGRRFMAKPSNIRQIGLLILVVGICAVLVSDLMNLSGQLLFAFGVLETLGGLYIAAFPAKAAARFEPLFSRSIKVWIGRGIAKCACGLAFVVWGAFFI